MELVLQDRRKPSAIQVIHSEPPKLPSRLHTINFKDRKGREETWLAENSISVGYVHEQNGMYLLSYYECDKAHE